MSKTDHQEEIIKTTHLTNYHVLKHLHVSIRIIVILTKTGIEHEPCQEDGPFTLDTFKHAQLPRFVVKTVRVLACRSETITQKTSTAVSRLKTNEKDTVAYKQISVL